MIFFVHKLALIIGVLVLFLSVYFFIIALLSAVAGLYYWLTKA